MASNMEKKVTKAMKFGAIASYFDTMDKDEVLSTVTVGKENTPVNITVGMVIEAMTHEVELLTKKPNDTKLTKAQEANLKLTNQLYADMEDNKAYTVTDLIKSIPCVAGLTPSKVRPLLTPLMNDNRVTREEVKGRPYFTKVQ